MKYFTSECVCAVIYSQNKALAVVATSTTCVFVQVGLYLQQLHESKGVKFYMNASMIEIKGGEGGVEKVLLKSGAELKVRTAILCLDQTL